MFKSMRQGVSNQSIALISILVFTLWTLIYTVTVFEQFTTRQILTVFLSFLFIFMAFAYIFTENRFNLQIQSGLAVKRQDAGQSALNITTNNNFFVFIIILFLLMVLLSGTIPKVYNPYIHTYPLLETELGFGWHQDTAYHVSLIQSILHFGYPSIAQHGIPFNAYHVLSHYVDAVIIFISGVDPYDSYGLLFAFKIWLLISTISLFLAATLKSAPPSYTFFFSSLLRPY